MVVPPLPRVTHYRGLPWDEPTIVCFCLFLILLHQPAFYSRAPFRERSLRMQIMLGSLQRLHSGLEARGKRHFHIQSKLNVWGRERRESTGENGETEVEEKGATSERRKKMKRGKREGRKGSEAEQILRLWRHSGTSLNCSRFFSPPSRCAVYSCASPSCQLPWFEPQFALLCGAVFSEEGRCSRETLSCVHAHAHLHGDYSVD